MIERARVFTSIRSHCATISLRVLLLQILMIVDFPRKERSKRSFIFFSKIEKFYKHAYRCRSSTVQRQVTAAGVGWHSGGGHLSLSLSLSVSGKDRSSGCASGPHPAREQQHNLSWRRVEHRSTPAATCQGEEERLVVVTDKTLLFDEGETAE